MSDYELIQQAKVAAGVETRPRSKGYVNPRHVRDDDPAEVETLEVSDPPRHTMSRRPTPTEPRYTPDDPTDFTHLRAGESPVENPARDIRALADRVWRRLHG